MITGDLKNKIDRVWDAFWSGGISNPLEVIEQITYLLFIRRLDDLQTLAERKANRTGKPIDSPVFQPGQADLRWSRFKDRSRRSCTRSIGEEVFPYLRGLGGDGSTYSEHMKDARFTIPTPALLARVVDMLDDIPMDNRDTTGDLYEYMLSKIATAGTNGQFRTPRHIIKLMVDMTAPTPHDEICDPACGTAGFLVAASEYVRREHPDDADRRAQWKHFNHGMFHGYDFDSTMLRIGSMNMLLHGVEQPDIRYRDSLSEGAAGEEGLYSLVLANPPFAGSLDYESTSKDLQRVVKTKKTELLFLALFLRLLKPGGRAAVIVPDGVLFGSVQGAQGPAQDPGRGPEARRRREASLGCLPPVRRSLDRDPVLHQDQLRRHRRRLVLRRPGRRVLARRQAQPSRGQRPPRRARPLADRDGEKDRARTEQSFLVPKADIVAQGYDLSLNRYKEIVHDEIEHRAPLEIIADIETLEDEIAKGLAELKAMLS